MLEKGNRANTLHGILLIALFSFAAFYIAEIPVVRRLSFSPLIVGIVLGMLYANSLRNRLPETWVPGIRFCTKQVLRWGIVLYGFRLTLAQVAAVGVPAVVVDLIVVTVTILGGVLLGRLPLIKKLKWREVLVCKGVWGTLSRENNGSTAGTQADLLFPAGMTSVSDPYVEAGFGVENIFRLFRVDCIWRLTHRSPKPGQEIQNFAVNLSLHLKF